MTGFITVNGVSSADFGVVLSDAFAYGKPSKDIERIKIPGRNGELIIDNNRYNNLDYEYPCAIIGDFDTNFTAFINYLLSQSGYMRIEDSFHPDEYVLAQYTGETSPTRVKKDRIGTFKLPFNRKPQRFLKDGEDPLPDITEATNIHNREYMTALPLIRVYGTGYLYFGDSRVKINQMASGASYTDIDCDTQDAFYGTINCNSNIELTETGFPKLVPGSNTVTFTNTISRVIVTPRWWRL